MKSEELFGIFKKNFNNFLISLDQNDVSLTLGTSEVDFFFEIEDSFSSEVFLQNANKVIFWLKGVKEECRDLGDVVTFANSLQISFRQMIYQKLLLKKRK